MRCPRNTQALQQVLRRTHVIAAIHGLSYGSHAQTWAGPATGVLSPEHRNKAGNASLGVDGKMKRSQETGLDGTPFRATMTLCPVWLRVYAKAHYWMQSTNRSWEFSMTRTRSLNFHGVPLDTHTIPQSLLNIDNKIKQSLPLEWAVFPSVGRASARNLCKPRELPLGPLSGQWNCIC